MDNEKSIKDEVFEKELSTRKPEAEETIQDEDKFEKLIQKLERSLEKMPVLGKYMADLACMISLVRSYMKKEYTEVPVGTIVSLVATIIYIASPVDLIPDNIPVAGQLDDTALLLWTLKSFHDDIENYKKWRKDNNKQVIDTI